MTFGSVLSTTLTSSSSVNGEQRMFNAPRATQRYTSTSSNGFGGGLGGSFTAENPLAGSAYDGLDPWSSAPTPDLPPPPSAAPPSPFSAIIADATAPPLYHRAYNAVDVSGTGEISISALSRVLLTSGLSASTIDRIVNLVSSRPRVSKLEFFVALALVALAQQEKDLSIEQVAVLAAQNDLPIPSLDVDAIVTSTSAITSPGMYRRDSGPVSSKRNAQPAFSDDPWTTPFPTTGEASGAGSLLNGAPSSLSGTGMPKDWWRRQERVQVRLLGPQGFILNRYMVYEVSTERGTPVQRRYSEFAFLWDVLVRRYPFRLLPQLPPKRIGPDEHFIEQRRRGLQRFLNFVVNHPIIKDDGVLAVFVAEPSLEQWRKHTAISLEEESASKRVDKVEEMSIPSDLDDKLGAVRGKIGAVIEQWQKICLLSERLIKRREAAAVRNPHALFRRKFLPSLLTPSVPSLPTSSAASVTSSPPASPRSLASSVLPVLPSVTVFGSFAAAPLVGSARPDGAADGGYYTSYFEDPQADMSRLTITLNALNEVNAQCWRGEGPDGCELCSGVRQGLEQVSSHVAKQSEDLDNRARVMSTTILEALKMQRDLYIAMRDLFIRHDRLSGDNVERLKKRIEGNQLKLETYRSAQKEGWQAEVDKLTTMIERDQAMISSLLSRRIFIRASMWHELRVVLHNRENTLITQAVREFARDESAFAELVANNWGSLVDAVADMPYE